METMIQYRYDAKNDEWVCEHVEKGVLLTMSGRYVRENAINIVHNEPNMFRLLVAELLLTMFEHTDDAMSIYVLTRAFNADNMQRVMVGLSHDAFEGVI